jgi:hypothetical protein
MSVNKKVTVPVGRFDAKGAGVGIAISSPHIGRDKEPISLE